MREQYINIGLDLERLRNVNSGLGQFCAKLTNSMRAYQPKNMFFHSYFPKNFVDLPHRINEISYHITGFDKFFGINNDHLQLFHAFHQDCKYVPKSKKIKKVMTIHDLNFIEKYHPNNPKIIQKLRLVQNKINKCDGLVFISKYTESQVRKYLKIPNHVLTRVIYNGAYIPENVDKSIPQWLLETTEPFYFSIGIIQAKKNFGVLLPLIKEMQVKWIIAGNFSDPYAAKIMKDAKQMGIDHLIVMPGQITESEKHWCYQHCEAFLFPSLSEGFGLPVIEAMSFGKPTFISDKTALPEIGGKVAFYWDNFDPEYICQTFIDGMRVAQLDPLFDQKIKAHAKQFIWDDAAKNYIDFYNTLLNKEA